MDLTPRAKLSRQSAQEFLELVKEYDLCPPVNENASIVDYKSERVEASEIAALAKHYEPQIKAYAEIWEKVTSQPVHEFGLFFTHTGEYVTLVD